MEHQQSGDVWLGTDNGISRFRKGTFNNFYFGANSLENACTEDNAVELDNGHLAFATHHGVMTFNPGDIHESKPAFPLAITKIEANGISIGELIYTLCTNLEWQKSCQQQHHKALNT